jgi:hypothetical protein
MIVSGEVAERSKAAVLKTVEGFVLRGFESLPLRQSQQFELLYLSSTLTLITAGREYKRTTTN